MATNPFFSNKTSPNGATAPNDSLNESYKRYFRGYNKFNLTRPLFQTERYADINLIEAVEGVEGDKLNFASKHSIRSYTLKAPVEFELYKKKTYFAVNNLAILPNNWKKVYKQPNKGDDVDYHVNCVSDYQVFLYRLLTKLKNIPNDQYLGSFFSATKDNYNYLWRILLLLESIHSDGSLLASMNGHFSRMIKVSDGKTFDAWLEETFEHFRNTVLIFKLPSISTKYFAVVPVDPTYINVDLRSAIDLLRTFSDFAIVFNNTDAYKNQYNYLLSRLQMLSLSYDADISDPDNAREEDAINFSRLVAYQLVCSQFYTRDSVDNIYTAEEFIDNAKSTILEAVSMYSTGGVSRGTWPQFTYNGSKVDYDVFSGMIIDTVLAIFDGYGTQAMHSITFDHVLSAYNYLHMLFFYRKSLRYGDYFVGAKTLPYAPMDVTADVVANGVSALDMTRSIAAQRFANAVERVSNTWKDYLKGITGGTASPNPYEPRFLASSTSQVSGFQVENTSERQFTNENITTILKSSNSNYVYEMEVSEPCIIIGVSTYEVPRVYSATVDRFFHHTDRFNMFNKFFQNIGDQEISQNERNASFITTLTFGYTPRHMEYKQRYPIAAGGFVNNLPGYAFITDNEESGQDIFDMGTGVANDYTKISSFYLRNRNSEFDRFYASLTGLGLASYFHFQVKYYNICHATRQMEYSPSIL